MKRPPIPPREPRVSAYGIDPALIVKRGADLPGICSLRVTGLFPAQPEVIYERGRLDLTEGERV